ncbi:hypothetical protein TVAG_249290 [Trichomonas vaginalis G3]|uniref:Uncharacterized protein n=1 Tax=Trichomonas vaginalis (strain ATCC PRA-98 / G3) TaxID=412133 RepID=A2DCD2_TRIV3|nr:hypothetical protein TVAGG3_0957450 [Trichomonas vaginalis G3]EAY21869.1 hypothetical protein TVAG_249290 [Trichomonas vaginalis G3]KAI5487657.1 hypothetical protein TVAGG3_0957450 [Trichomonas vaginalis G3]|eukprot:XP_001582855.1 hypothetical protein [Trichomonas vaginalis G3]
MSEDEAMIKGLHESLSSLDNENREYSKYKSHLESAVASVTSANERLLQSYKERCGILDKTNASIKEYDNKIRENQAKLEKLRIKNATFKKYVVYQTPNQTIIAMKKASKRYKEDTDQIEQQVYEMLKNNPNADEIQKMINEQNNQYKILKEDNARLRRDREIALAQAIQYDSENGKQLQPLLIALQQKLKENNRLYKELENTESNLTNVPQRRQSNDVDPNEYFDLIDILDESDFEDEKLRSLARGDSIDTIKIDNSEKLPGESILQPNTENGKKYSRHVVKENGDEYDYSYSENEDGTKGTKHRHKLGGDLSDNKDKEAQEKQDSELNKENEEKDENQEAENGENTNGKKFSRHVVKENGDEYDYSYSENEDGTKGTKHRHKVGADTSDAKQEGKDENENGSKENEAEKPKKIKKKHHSNQDNQENDENPEKPPKKFHSNIEGIIISEDKLLSYNQDKEVQYNSTEIMTDYSALQDYRNTENQQKHLNLLLHEKIFNEISALEQSILECDQNISINEELKNTREKEFKERVSRLSIQNDVASYSREPTDVPKSTVDVEVSAKSSVDIQDLKNQIAENNQKTSEAFLQQQQALDLRDTAAKLELELSVIRLANDRKTNELNGLMAKLKNINANEFNTKPERLKQIKMNMSDKEKIDRRKERLEGVDKILKQREIDLVKLERKVVDLQTINESIQKEIREKVAAPKLDIKSMCDDLRNARQKMKDCIRRSDFLRIESDALKESLSSLQSKYNSDMEKQLKDKVDKLQQQVDKQKQKFFSLKGVTNSTITLTCDDELLWLQVRLNEIKEAIDVIKMRAGSTATKIDKQIKQCKDLNIPLPEPPEEYEDVLNARFQKRIETYN